MNTSGTLEPSSTPVTVRPLRIDSGVNGNGSPRFGTVHRPQVPSRARQSMASRKVCSAPAVSTENCAPPSVRATMRSTTSPSRASRACVAPNSRASARRAGSTSTAMIGAQPASLAAITADRPTDPTPNTARLDPAGQARVLNTAPAPVWMPQPSGPASSSGSASGMRSTLRSVASAWVAKEDCWKKAPWTGRPAWSVSVPLPSARAPPNCSAWPCMQ